jgi:YihY family inner membrane protein
VSQVQPVPETYQLSGDDIRKTLANVGWQHLLKESFQRLRLADGFSHARAMAYALALLLVEGSIAIVGLAVATGSSGFGKTVVDVIQGAVPGPAGKVLTSAVSQAQEAGSQNQYLALLLGLGATLITATTTMGQFERSCNRLYGVEHDRPSLQKYGRAFLLAVTAGAASAAGVLLLVLGRPIEKALDDGVLGTVWAVARWPLALILITVAATALLKWSPNRRQPGYSWLAYGAATSMLLTVAVSVGLALFFRWSTTFGDTYGPLAGMIGLLIWCLLLAVASLYGIAVTAQLEFERNKSSSTEAVSHWA